MSELTLDEQREKLTEQAVEIACKAAGKYREKEGLTEMETEEVVKSVIVTIAKRWNEVMKDCREALEMNGKMTEVVFEAGMIEAGIDAVKKLEEREQV